jgi:His/Glu/Gln/Arg/opine family amino acid ABC transporter permease subunit
MISINLIKEIFPFIIEGAIVTLKYALFSTLLALPFGFLLALIKISNYKIARFLADGYTSIFRGTPLLVQLLMIYYATPQVLGIDLEVWQAGILTFTLNSIAYTSEIIRGGLNAIDPGQWEAGFVLGFSRYQILRYIILPQVFRTILPSLLNESIDMLKESSLMCILSEMDLLRRAQIVAAQKFVFFEPYIVVAIIYFFLVKILTILVNFVEKKLSSNA